jgi:hypothetical protein
MREFTGREHVPGAAWAIVGGDRVAHTGVIGLRRSNGAGDGRTPMARSRPLAF